MAPAIISVVCLPKTRRADATVAFLQGNRLLAAAAVRLGLINQPFPAASLDAAVDAALADLPLAAPGAPA